MSAHPHLKRKPDEMSTDTKSYHNSSTATKQFANSYHIEEIEYMQKITRCKNLFGNTRDSANKILRYKKW